MAPQFSSFVADEDEASPQDSPFRSFTPDEEEKPSAARRFSDAVGQTINTALTPLPKHKPVDLPSSSEVEDAARMFEGKPSESVKQKEKPKEVHSNELKPAASHQERKEEGYGHTKVGSFIESVIGKGIDYYKEHPKIGEFLFGRDEIDGHKVVGPGFQTIPGIRRGADALANIIDPKTGESSYGRGLAAGSLQGLAGVLETGTDPRTVGTGPARPEKPFGFDEFSASPIEPQGPKQIGFGQTEEAASIRPPRRLLTAGDETPIPQDLSVRRASNLPPDLAAPGEESIFNAKRAEDVVKPIEQSLFERARAATGGKELPDELAVSRRTPEETARILGEEPPSQEMQTFEPEVPEEKPNFVNPFKKPDISEAEPQFQRVEGKIGPYKDVAPARLVDLVSKGRKPSAILENLAPREMDALVARAKELGLHVTENPVVANEPIISKDADTGRRLAQSIYDGDHETTGHLLGYSPADTRKFSEAMDKFNSFEPEEDEPLFSRRTDDYRVGSSQPTGSTTFAKTLKEASGAELLRIRREIADDLEHLSNVAKDLPATMNKEAAGMAKRRVGMTKAKLAQIDEEVLNRSDEEPSTARTESGGTRMDISNVKDMIKIFRNTHAGSVPHVATKETVQNAIDAANENTDPNVNPAVHIDVNKKTHEITTTDNGPGLTREMVDTVYSDLSGSGKRGKGNTIGEMGVGKVTYMIAGEHVKVSSVARDPKTLQLIKIDFEGTPDQIMDEFHPVETVVPEGTPTGTKVTVRVKKNTSYNDLDRYLQHLKDYSSNPVPITVKAHGSYYDPDNFDMEIPAKSPIKGKPIGKQEQGTGAKFKLSIPGDAQWGDRGTIALILNNRGMFQGVDTFYVGSKADLPDRIVVDLEPTVPATDEDYPLTVPTRERMKDSIKYEVGSVIQRELIEARTKKRKRELQNIFDDAKKPKGKNKITMYDSGGQLTKEEVDKITSSPTVKAINEIMKIIVDALRESTGLAEDIEVQSGILLDSKLRGVNLRNPGDYKDFISMVNIFAEMENRDPKRAAQGIVHVVTHEFTHVTVRNEGSEYTSHLATVYENFDLDAQTGARDAIIEILTGGEKYTGREQEYSPEAEELLSLYKESRGREPTTSDILVREAGSGVIGPEEPSLLPKRDKPTGAGTLKSAIEKLLTGLEEAKGLRQKQEGMYTKERARRFAAFEGVKSTGAAGAAKSLGKLKGEYDKVGGIELGLSEKEVDSLFNAVKFAQISTPEKARAYSALFEMLEGEVVPQRNQLKVLDDVFGDGFANRVVEMHGGIGPIGFKLAKTANTMKAMRSSFDFSAPFRQGIGLVHRPEFWKAFVEMFRYYGDKKYFNDAMEEMTKDPYYLLAREAGLFLAKHNDFLQGEEAFMNSYIGNIPKMTGIPMAIDASERAYTGFLNKLRFDTFKNLIKNAKSSGSEAFTTVTDEESGKTRIAPTKVAQNLAKYINVSTGRGSLGRFEKIAPELNAAIWSPRLISSRLNILMNPKYYMDMDPFTRREAIKTLFAIAAAATTIGAISYVAGGGETSMNPLSADFLKSRRKGNAVIDPLAGFQQPIVAAARMITGSNATRSQSSGTTLENFAVNKLSPIAGLAYELAYSQRPWNMRQAPGDMSTLGIPQFGGFKDKFGQQKYANTEIIKSFVPMFIQDVTDVMKADPSFAEQIGLNTASAFGIGIQNYPKQGAKNKIPKMNMRRLQP